MPLPTANLPHAPLVPAHLKLADGQVGAVLVTSDHTAASGTNDVFSTADSHVRHDAGVLKKLPARLQLAPKLLMLRERAAGARNVSLRQGKREDVYLNSGLASGGSSVGDGVNVV